MAQKMLTYMWIGITTAIPTGLIIFLLVNGI